MTPALAWGLGLGALAWWCWAGRLRPGAPEAPRPDGGPDRRPRAWVEIDGSPIWLMRDVRYRACVDLPFGVGRLATDARVTRELERAGFRDVTIRRDVEGCDLLLEATWSAGPAAKPRPGAVRRAWGFFVVGDDAAA